MIISKEIITNTVKVLDNPLMSKFKPKGLKKILETIPKDNMVLGVGYKEGDLQIGISGKRKFGERLEETVNREMIEEVNLSCNVLLNCMKKINNNYFFKINISNTRLFPCYLQRVDEREDTKDRVILCIYGPEQLMLKYIQTVKVNKNNGDFITSVWCDTVENILKDHFE